MNEKQVEILLTFRIAMGKSLHNEMLNPAQKALYKLNKKTMKKNTEFNHILYFIYNVWLSVINKMKNMTCREKTEGEKLTEGNNIEETILLLQSYHSRKYRPGMSEPILNKYSN